MALPLPSSKGDSLIAVVEDMNEHYFFNIPNNKNEMQHIEDYFLAKANHVEFFYEDIFSNEFKMISNFEEFEYAKKRFRNPQGIAILVRMKNVGIDNKDWKCQRCMTQNVANAEICKLCKNKRIFKGVKKTFN